MNGLCAEDFAAFFREVNDGHDPFPWQQRLASEVFRRREWPKCLDLPTAAGKTAVLEIAIFHLALEAALGAGRRAPVRIAFVVDRRLIVDQTYERACRIQKALDPNAGTIAGKVARALRTLSPGEESCLWVQKLRGGLPRESDWARTPIQPTILLSTVDQVGSRLLFRGYGVSNSMRPIHAGLLGSDCLIFLDEAHLAEPFRQSLEWVERYRGKPWTEFEPGPWAVVTLSATPGEQDGDTSVVSLSPEDLNHAVLGKRLAVRKPAELRETAEADLAAVHAQAARELAKQEGINRILIVVNRVDLARAVFDKLNAEGTEEEFLLTGRVRDIDRTEIVSRLQKALEENGRKLFAVATQTVEVGADFDFDGLVTQIAPLDALRQRFGRLNRTGRDIAAKAIVIAAKEELKAKKPDPIYGFAARGAWEALNRIARVEKRRRIVDFGSLALGEELKEKFTPGDLVKASCEKPDAPVMPPAYVDLWACTNPPPSVEPEVALFLHGAERASADVEIVWRKDISVDDLDERNQDRLKRLIALVPPRAPETLSVPLWKVRQWLAGDPNASRVGDIEGESEPGDAATSARKVFRWRGADDDQTRVIWEREIRPGDVVIVPASYGGCDESGCWTGRHEPAVKDRALEAAAQLKTRQIAIRLHRDLFEDDVWALIAPLLEMHYEDPETLRAELADVLTGEALSELQAIERLEDVTLYVEERPGEGLILTGRRVAGRESTVEPSTESDHQGSFGRSEVSLSDHTEHVVAKVELFARGAGLSEPVRQALRFAAQFHDSGKGDRRFQRVLHNGRDGSTVLAKSALRTRPRGLPENWRHEALSVRIAMQDPQFADSAGSMDRDLALWLIGTHHGCGRPFFPHDDELDDHPRQISGAAGEALHLDAAPGPQRLDFTWDGVDWAGLFDRLQRRYGFWELARFEAILRLADHRASEEEEDAKRTYSARSGT
ncbi:MAG: type I-U CRISPR-associated helicase/endonuclease Cas3 [Rhodospirillales bacterium]